MAIYVHRNSQQLGPYSAAEVKSQLASGALSVHDHVWWKGASGWVPLGQSTLMKNGFQELPGTEQKPPPLPSGLSPFALGSFLCSFLSLIGGPLATIPGIIMGHLSLSEIRKNPKRTGRKLAITGLVLNYIMTLVTTVVIVSFVMFHDQIEQVNEREEIKAETPPPLPVLPVAPPVVPSVPANAPPAETNTPTAAPVSSAPAATNVPDQSANPAPAITNAAPATNAPDSNPNTGPIKD
jgi:Domain of unknown function (DUF4190)/GYF domain 2